MATIKHLNRLAEQIRSKSRTLEHALRLDRDLLTLMELSVEISQLSSQFREQVLSELDRDWQSRPQPERRL